MSDSIRRVVHAMAMPFTVELNGVDAAAGERAIAGFHADLQYADDLFSLWRDDTPMAAVARGDLSVGDAPREVGEVMDLCDHFRDVTGGAFDARRADGVTDPTGIVKAWAVARAVWRFGAAGAAAWMVGASGDVLVAPGAGTRRIGIADPRRAGDPHGGPVVEVIELGGTLPALASSGGSQDEDHIWDPATGRPARHVLQASVAGRDFIACDAWATAIAAAGPAAAERAVAAGLEVLVVESEREDGAFLATASSGWPRAAEV